MVGRSFFRPLVAILLVIGVIALAVGAYNVGLSSGLASAGGTGVAVVRGPYWYGGWGWGWGFFGLLFPIFFFLLFFLLIRAAFWGGGRHQGYGRWDGDRSAMFDEWHRRAHGEPGQRPDQGGSATPGSALSGQAGQGGQPPASGR